MTLILQLAGQDDKNHHISADDLIQCHFETDQTLISYVRLFEYP